MVICDAWLELDVCCTGRFTMSSLSERWWWSSSLRIISSLRDSPQSNSTCKGDWRVLVPPAGSYDFMITIWRRIFDDMTLILGILIEHRLTLDFQQSLMLSLRCYFRTGHWLIVLRFWRWRGGEDRRQRHEGHTKQFLEEIIGILNGDFDVL